MIALAARPARSVSLRLGLTVAAVVLGLAGAARLAVASSPSAAVSASSTPVSPVARPALRAASASRPAPPRSTRPEWSELSPSQQQALAPLASSWPTLREAQKRKWIALSVNYQKLSPDERTKLHSRMSGWAALSPQQRTQARLNFGETQGLPADDKKAKWEAYQALPPEEKRRLAAGAQAKTPATAAAVKPVPAQKLATVPKTGQDARPAQDPAMQN
jgi:hypothetical protein